MRESYEDYYLIVVLVLFVLVPKLRQFAEVKAPGILWRRELFPVSGNSILILLSECPSACYSYCCTIHAQHGVFSLPDSRCPINIHQMKSDSARPHKNRFQQRTTMITICALYKMNQSSQINQNCFFSCPLKGSFLFVCLFVCFPFSFSDVAQVQILMCHENHNIFVAL